MDHDGMRRQTPQGALPAKGAAAHRLTALCAVALFVLSVGLLKGLAAEAGGPPVQSVAWLFGPAPQPHPIDGFQE
jgi:hypothetical protein